MWVRADADTISASVLSSPGSCFSLNTISRRQSWARLALHGAALGLPCQSHGFFTISLCLGSGFAWGGCFGNTRIFLPLFMCASTVHFSQRNGSLIDLLNVRTRLPRNKYLRLTRKGNHHLLKHQPRNYFPREGNEWITVLYIIFAQHLIVYKGFHLSHLISAIAPER